MTSTPLTFEFFNEIGIIDQLASTMFVNALPAGMTKAQFTVLNHFVRLNLNEKSPADLANAFQVRRPTMTSTLARMEQAGLVHIRDNPDDGRAKLVAITAAGHHMRERCILALADLIPAMASIISDEEMQSLLHTLKKLRAALDSARD